MRILRTNLNLPPGLVILLVILLIPILIFVGLIYLICWAVLGAAPALFGLFPRDKGRRRSRVYGEQYRDARTSDHAATETDDAIECEVISARTIDENGREID
ncbi:MAG: hypothetical protein PUC15_08815 [Lentisphaeria bacterium]|nr:hypothetical protein [Lentisphaeria bacterium]